MEEICAKHKVQLWEVQSKSREWRLIPARIEISAVLLCNGLTLKRVGKYVKKDHSTVAHYVRDLDLPRATLPHRRKYKLPENGPTEAS